MHRGIEIEKDRRVIVGKVRHSLTKIMIAARASIVDKDINGSLSNASKQRINPKMR